MPQWRSPCTKHRLPPKSGISFPSATSYIMDQHHNHHQSSQPLVANSLARSMSLLWPIHKARALCLKARCFISFSLRGVILLPAASLDFSCSDRRISINSR